MGIDFWILAVVVTMTPGTGVLFTVVAALGRGRGAGVVAALGCTLGIVPHAAVAMAAAATAAAIDPLIFAGLRWAGAAYLAWMAVSLLRGAGPLRLAPGDEAPSAVRVVRAAVLVNLLNPKPALFFLALLPQVVAPGQRAGAMGAMLAATGAFMVVTFVGFCGYALLAAAFRRGIETRPRALVWLQRAFGVSFLGLGLQLALTG